MNMNLSDWSAIREKVARLDVRYGRAKLAENLYGYRRKGYPPEGYVFIRHHGAEIARLYDNGDVEFNFCDYPSVTTVGHIQALLAHVTVERNTWKSPYLQLGGNLWLGFAERPRRKGQDCFVTMTVHDTEDYWEGREIAHYEGRTLYSWNRMSDLIPNWLELVRQSENGKVYSNV